MKTVKQLMDLTSRVGLITGGAGHLGYAMAEALAEAGADICLLDIDYNRCKKKAALLEKHFSVRAVPLKVDLRDDAEIKHVPSFISRQFGRLDILINAAALVGTSDLKGWSVPFEEQSIDTWRLAMDVNLTSVFALTQVCASMLKKSGKGSVINISSIYGIVAPDMHLYDGTKLGNPAAYAVSKAGLIQLTRWLAANMCPRVRVNAISIGGVFRGHKDPFLSRYTQRTLLGRMAREQDIKGAALYLASDLSLYVTGHNLVVDGGWSVI